MCYRASEDGCLEMNIHSHSKIPKPVNLLAVIYEVDLYKKWVPFCVENVKLTDISRLAKAALIRCDVKGKFRCAKFEASPFRER